MIETAELLKSVASKPELALLALILGGFGWMAYKFSSQAVEILKEYLKKIDENFTSIAGDVKILRSKLETHITITDERYVQLDKRLERLEEKVDEKGMS